MPGSDTVNVYSVTGTVDHKLTDNLTAKAEIRWDNAPFDVFDDLSNNNQVIALGQLMYEF